MIRSIALTIAIVLLSRSIAHASVRITEIAWMGTAESQFGEWFELYNDSTDTVDLAGWKLYEAGGDTVVFTLTKSIPAQGYLLVERTTASSPDPVAGINDESGTFGGSGFSNSGEHLVLKDVSGTIVQSLNFLSGWPAGSADTKQTMQWDGAKWLTAVATPKAPSPTGGGDNPPPADTPSSTAWSAPKEDPFIELSIPKTVYATIASEYSAKTVLEYQDAYTGVFLWNMGDGSTYRSDTPTAIKHTYAYPGTYTISFAYYRNAYDKKPFLSSSVEKIVSDPQISFAVLKNKGFSFTNTDAVAIDISGWVIVAGDKTIELPPFTSIAPKKTVVMPFSVFGITPVTSAILQTPERTSLQQPVDTIVKKTTGTATSNVIPVQSSYSIESADLGASVVEAQPDTPAQSSKNHLKTGIFIVVLVIVIGLFIALERSAVSRQEE